MTTTARLMVLWGRPSDPAAFERHYREVHIPLALRIPGLRRYTLSRDITLARGEDAYYLVAELDFDDITALRAGFQSPQGQATAADVANLSRYATVKGMIYQLEDLLRQRKAT
ncbi:MAG: EthD family reductase [Trebonia sp.]